MLDVPTPEAPRGLGASVSLQELRAKGTATEWYEAIAIAQGLCRSLIEDADHLGPARLDMADVFLDESGRVATVPHDPGTTAETVVHIGHIISQLLPDHDFMFLRDRLVAKATATPPVYRSIDELSEALEYYERPNRHELIQAVYQRWVQGDAPVVPAPGPVAVLPVAAPQPTQPPVPEVQPPDGGGAWATLQGDRLRYVVAGVAALVLLAGLGAFSMWIGRPRPVESTEATNVQPDLPLVDVPAPAPKPQRPAIFRAVRTKLSPEAPSITAPVVAIAEPPAPAPAPAPRAAAEAVVVPPAPATIENRQIHRSTDPDVAPPRLIYPQTLSPVLTAMPRSDFMTFEVVVDDRGLVESVKAKDSPHTIGELLILLNALSSAKSWRFDPALRLDAPVRYSQLVALPLR